MVIGVGESRPSGVRYPPIAIDVIREIGLAIPIDIIGKPISCIVTEPAFPYTLRHKAGTAGKRNGPISGAFLHHHGIGPAVTVYIGEQVSIGHMAERINPRGKAAKRSISIRKAHVPRAYEARVEVDDGIVFSIAIHIGQELLR